MAGPVVVGVSGSVASFHAARVAAEMHGDARRYVLVRWVPSLEEGDASARQVLLDAEVVLGRPADRRIVVGGRPGDALVDVAGATGASEIVVGARPEDRSWTHPVAAHVLRHAPCAVLLAVVPTADVPAETG